MKSLADVATHLKETEANQVCEADGAKLPLPKSEEENIQLIDFANDMFVYGFFLGIRDISGQRFYYD